MKTRRFMVIIIALALTLPAQFLNTSRAELGKYWAQLLTPTAGQVLYPGQIIKVEWRSWLPPVDLHECETEIWMSLDGGITYTILLSPWMDPNLHFFYWTVPNTPTNTAVLEIRFGCEAAYPESYAPQPASQFVIKPSPGT